MNPRKNNFYFGLNFDFTKDNVFVYETIYTGIVPPTSNVMITEVGERMTTQSNDLMITE